MNDDFKVNDTDDDENNDEFVFEKKAFLKSQKYKHWKDLISILLDDNKLYSEKDVHNIINKYLKRSGL